MRLATKAGQPAAAGVRPNSAMGTGKERGFLTHAGLRCDGWRGRGSGRLRRGGIPPTGGPGPGSGRNGSSSSSCTPGEGGPGHPPGGRERGGGRGTPGELIVHLASAPLGGVRAETRRPAVETVEIAHEALLITWERLRGVDRDRSGGFVCGKKNVCGRLCASGRRATTTDGALLRGVPLAEATGWRRQPWQTT